MDEARRSSDITTATAYLEKHGKLLTLLALGAIGYLRLSWTVDALKKESDERQASSDGWRSNRTNEITQLKIELERHDADIAWLKMLARERTAK